MNTNERSEDITRWREDTNFIFSWQKHIAFATRK